MDQYDTAQICLNGHVISKFAASQPDHQAKHCPTCGQPTIMVCQSCNAPIRGAYHMSGIIATFPYSSPSYCYNCGKSFPWTEKGINAAKELAYDLEGLTEQEKDLLTKSIDEIVQ